MSYNNRAHNQSLSTAGKITILTAVSSLFIFLAVFLLNLGQTEIQTVQAQSTATTSVNVKNTPPEFVTPGGLPREQIASATSTPTNSGDDVVFLATAIDQNDAPYFLIICDTSDATAQSGSGTGTAAPICGGTQIALSTSTVSGQEAFATITTNESMPEVNDWWAFVCDDDTDNPECSDGLQGDGSGSATSSPFVVNHRPVFDGINLNPDADPNGDTLTFTASTSDQDTVGGQDTVRLFVCVDGVFDTVNDECTNGTIASSTLQTPSATTPEASTTTPAIIPDGTRPAHVFVVDEHGHEAQGGQQGTNTQYTINNVFPTINLINLNGGEDLVVDNPATTTEGFTLDFEVFDANSCENLSSGPEIVDYVVSIYHTGLSSSSTCNSVGAYNPNHCYPSVVGPAVWNISCAATTTGPGVCGGQADGTETWSCTFPLWYVADPTDEGAPTPVYSADNWFAAVAAVDDNGGTTTIFTQSSGDVDVQQYLGFNLVDDAIPYGSLAPNENTVSVGTTSITTDIEATGNVGVDVDLTGVLMCPEGFPIGTCPATSTSSIPVTEQRFSSSTFSTYLTDGLPLTTGNQVLEINVPKPISTSTQPFEPVYWALRIPDTITFAGSYTGRNTFLGVTSDPANW